MKKKGQTKSLLRFRFRIPLDRFNLEVDFKSQHRVLGVWGPSGSGKTTFLESVAGLRRKARGYMRCDDVVWMDSGEGIFQHTEERGIGYVPQDHLLFPHLTVIQNLKFGISRSFRAPRDLEMLFQEVVEVLELRPLLDRKPASLSGGEKQRVSLGRALCSNPCLLMLDEPLASLDISLRRRILPFLLKVRDHFDVPMLMVSHDPFELQALCEEVLALRDGKIVAQGAPTDVFTRSDIYKSAADEAFQNLLAAKVVGDRDYATSLKLGSTGEGASVLMAKNQAAIGQRVLIGFPANDILVALSPVEGISARNQLSARISNLYAVGSQQMMRAQLMEGGQETLVVELTQDAVRELDLEVGANVYLIFKSSAITVYS